MKTLSKQDIVDRLLPLSPYKVILLGSRAWGTPGPDSDIDLLVVLDDEMISEDASSQGTLYKLVARRLREIERTVPLDLIVHTRPMHRTFLDRDSMFARKVKREGEVLYAKGN